MAAILTRFRLFVLMILAAAAGAAGAGAQDAPAPDTIDLTADRSIEWLQDERKIEAIGNATIRDQDLVIRAERILAYYRDKAGGGTEVWRVEMHGGVVATWDGGTLEGQDGAYESDSRVFVLTGTNLRYSQDDLYMTATDTLEYWRRERMAVARGDASVVEGRRNVRGDIVTALFRDEDQPRPAGADSDILRFDAFGNVRITTEEEVILAQKATYDPNADSARMTGSVKITRGNDQLNGDVADVDFDKGIAKLSGTGGSRVRGLITPND